MNRTKDERIKLFSDLFVGYHDCVADEYLRNQNLMAYLNSGGFFTAPASTKYHGVYEGGLFDHSMAVTRSLEEFTERMGLKWDREESPFIVGMFHDLCKCDQYIKVMDAGNITELSNGSVIETPEEFHYEYNTNTLLNGQGAKSGMILSQFITLTEEEMLCIRYHMGAYEKDEWPEFDLAIKKYENVLWTHTADMYASKVMNT